MNDNFKALVFDNNASPKEIIEQYEEWEKYYKEKMKIKFQHLL